MWEDAFPLLKGRYKGAHKEKKGTLKCGAAHRTTQRALPARGSESSSVVVRPCAQQPSLRHLTSTFSSLPARGPRTPSGRGTVGLVRRGPEYSPRRGAKGATKARQRQGAGAGGCSGTGRVRRWREEEAAGRKGDWEAASRPSARTALPNLRLPQSRRRRAPYRARREVHKVLEQRGENSKRVYSTSSWLRGPAMETSTVRTRAPPGARSAVAWDKTTISHRR